MDKTTDRYTITTYDNTGMADLYITGLDTKAAQLYVETLEEEGIEFYLELVSVEEA